MTMASVAVAKETEPAVDTGSLEFLTRMSELVPGIINVFNHQTMSNEYTNRSLGPMLGYKSEEIIAMGDTVISKVIHPDDIDKLVDYFASIGRLKDGEVSTFVYRDVTKSGATIWVRSIDTVFERAADGSVLRHLGIVFDITDKKLAEERLNDLNRELEIRIAERTQDLILLNSELESRVRARTAELELINAELAQLTHVATHDLRVPVNNMCTLTDMLAEASPVLPPEHVETLDWMRQVCEQARLKLDALVSVSQLSEQVSQTKVTLVLAVLAQEVVEHVRARRGGQKGLIEYDFDSATEVTIAEDLLKMALETVIDNAMAYAHPSRRMHIKISSNRASSGTVIEIADNGTGLSLPQDEEKVFGLFRRAHAVPTGSGVGLYLVRRHLNYVRGQITVRAGQPHGCIFSIEIPDPLTQEARE